MEIHRLFYVQLILVIIFSLSNGAPTTETESIKPDTSVLPLTSQEVDELIDADNSTTNGTHKELYVIKAVVYEIGILTEVSDNDTSSGEDNFSQERVDLTFFDAHNNGSHYDLGDIPLPIQTNVSGQILTGIAPVHVGAIQDAKDILRTLPLTGTIVNITHSDTSFINLSHRPQMNENGTILDEADLAKIPGINGTKPIIFEKTNEIVGGLDAKEDSPATVL